MKATRIGGTLLGASVVLAATLGLGACSAVYVAPPLPAATGDAASDCPPMPGMAQIDVGSELGVFGLTGTLPDGHCDYDDTSGSYSPGDHFVLVVWPTPPSGLLDGITSVATASGFTAAPVDDSPYPDGTAISWSSDQNDAIAGAAITFDALPSNAAPAGWEAWTGKPFAWLGLHAPATAAQ